MKKLCITFLLSGIIILSAIGFATGKTPSVVTADTEYLRIHIRANSDESEDQAVKYLVRDAIVEYLTPLVAEAETRPEAEKILSSRLDEIERVAESVLLSNGYAYGAEASVRDEEFPTRVYGEYTLEAGVYRALIVELGAGAGQNWWCVVYPPLCFAGGAGGNVVYKSKIREIIEQWKASR